MNNYGFLTRFSQGPSHVTAWAPGMKGPMCKTGRFSRRRWDVLFDWHGIIFRTNTALYPCLLNVLGCRTRSIYTWPSNLDPGTGRTALDVKNYLWNHVQWQRQFQQPRVIWNGESGAFPINPLMSGNQSVKNA